MTGRAFWAVAGIVALQFASSLQAQPGEFGSLYRAVPRVPSLALSNSGNFSFATAFQWTESAPDFLPALSASRASVSRRTRANVANVDFSKDSSKDVVEMKKSNFFDYATAEVGFLYGKSTGRYGVESEQGYIIGEVGNEHLHISAGASYENANGRLPRFVR